MYDIVYEETATNDLQVSLQGSLDLHIPSKLHAGNHRSTLPSLVR